jgi:hypothetical protein
MIEARLYEKREDQKVLCRACSHHCLIKGGQRGICHVRENQQGTLYSLVYGKPIAAHVDPIEKKPLFHFLPGSTSFSIATPIFPKRKIEKEFPERRFLRKGSLRPLRKPSAVPSLIPTPNRPFFLNTPRT